MCNKNSIDPPMQLIYFRPSPHINKLLLHFPGPPPHPNPNHRPLGSCGGYLTERERAGEQRRQTTIDQAPAAEEIPSGMDKAEGGGFHGWNAETPGSANQQPAASSFKMPLLFLPPPPSPLYTRIAETFPYTRLGNPDSAAAVEISCFLHTPALRSPQAAQVGMF
ncbi:unnamed protein product [Eretmochelys imbricata]